MGRYVDITVVTSTLEKSTIPKYSAASLGGTIAQSQAYGTVLRYGGKAYYDGKQCWQYKLVLDRPGAYCWTAPTGTVCARTVIVGGGGKPKCISVNFDGSTCNSAAGAGGGYSDKCHAVSAGSTVFCICVGRQEQDSTVACNGVAVHTAGGAAGMIPGASSGGDWNSRGGCAGWTCNYCGGSFSHYCGSCKYLCNTTCCGYCIVYQYNPASPTCSCCNPLYAGGGSAGSPRHTCGGCSTIICGYINSGVAGGGAGIGDYCQSHVWHYSCCNCVCVPNHSGMPGDFCSNCPGSAGGGGGTKPHNTPCRSYQAQCTGGLWKGGDGGPGGPDVKEGCAWTMEWGYRSFCAYPYGQYCNPAIDYRNAEPSCICRVCWWDIFEICGSGSPGTVFQKDGFNYTGYEYIHWGPHPRNSGEGAGTGGIMFNCCDPTQFAWGIGSNNGSGGPLVNWTKICQLGCCGWCDQAWLMIDAIAPFFITCAGTLGGSGGVGICGYTSKAGFGGGGGQAKCQLLCVCWGGSFDCCNGAASTPLAFPPCLLDILTSNAGTGLAIIYWREA